jgi:hypothetical protein
MDSLPIALPFPQHPSPSTKTWAQATSTTVPEVSTSCVWSSVCRTSVSPFKSPSGGIVQALFLFSKPILMTPPPSSSFLRPTTSNRSRLLTPVIDVICELITQRSQVQILPPQPFTGMPTHSQPIETGALERPFPFCPPSVMSGRYPRIHERVAFSRLCCSPDAGSP